MKIVARKSASPARFPLRLLAPVAFDGHVVQRGGFVVASDAQVTELITRGLAENAKVVDSRNALIVRERAVMEWPDEGTSTRQSKKWPASRIGRNRLAPRGSVRLDAGASIIEQVRNIVR